MTWAAAFASARLPNTATFPVAIFPGRSKRLPATRRKAGWLVMMKIEKAKRLLITSMPITDVVYECGFADHSHFTRTFSRLEGMTPKAWRRAFVPAMSHPLQTPVIDRDIPNWRIHESLVEGVGQSHARELHA